MSVIRAGVGGGATRTKIYPLLEAINLLWRAAMSRKFLPLIVLVLLSGSATAQQVLFENPYDPTGSGGVGISYSTAYSGATTFTLGSDSTVRAVSFTVGDVFSSPMGSYNWSIYSDVNGMPGGAPGPISGPTGAPTYLPIVSGQAGLSTSTFSWYPIVPPVPNQSISSINEVTIDLGQIDLSAGTYFLSLSGIEGVGAEGWLSGAYNTGNVSSFVGAFTPVSARGDALIVFGSKSTVSAPEIAPSSAIGALTLLLGSLMVLRGRRGQGLLTTSNC